MARTDFAIDLDGDGDPDNQLGGIIGGLTATGVIDAQPLVDEALREGRDPMQLQVLDDGAMLFGELEPGHQQGWFCGEQPTGLTLTLSFFANATVHLTAARLEVVPTGNGVSGQLHGAIRAEEVDQVVMPAVAEYLNAKLTGDPDSDLSKQIAMIFDDGGEGQCNGAGNGHIEPCEVRLNSIARNLFAPDVHLTGAEKDALSVGVAFAARKAAE